MLYLTRKAGDKVLIGTPPALTMTVLELRARQIKVRLKTNDDDVEYYMNQDEKYTVHIQSGAVTIQLVGIMRTEARLCFEAPEHIRIERPDRNIK
jgi:sRNA-binding carbon storage regulator CsrA